MLQLLFTISTLLLVYCIIKNNDHSKKWLIVIIGSIFIHNSIRVAGLSVHRILLYTLLFSEFYHFQRFRKEFKAFPLKRYIVLLIIGSIIIAFFDDRLNIVSKLYEPIRELTGSYFNVVLGYMCFRKVSDFKKIQTPLLLTLLIISIFGVFTWFIKNNVYNQIVISNVIEDSNLVQKNLYKYGAEASRFRVTSTFDSSFNYGFVSSLLAIFSFSLIITKLKSNKYLTYISFIFGTFGVILSNSRTVLMALFISLLVFILVSMKFSKKVLIIISIAFLSLTTYYTIPAVNRSINNTIDLFSGTSNNIEGSSIEMRAIQFVGATNYFLQSPILGNGFKYIYNDLGWGEGDKRKLDKDMYGFESIIYQLMIEQGIIGLLTHFLLFISLTLFFRRHLKSEKVLASLGISITLLFIIFAIGTGPLNAWPITMLFVGAIIKTIELKNQYFNYNL